LKQFFSKGKKKQMHNKKHFGGCMHKEGVFCYLSLEAILLQGKEETDAQQKHFGRCMHKEWFLICPLKHFFSKGKKKKMHTKALWRQQEEFSYCRLQHFYEGRMKER
jgi:hypothetical protein